MCLWERERGRVRERETICGLHLLLMDTMKYFYAICKLEKQKGMWYNPVQFKGLRTREVEVIMLGERPEKQGEVELI
jgi:hypothetical protein